MIHKTKFFAALALVGVVTSFASAGNVAVIPTVVGRFDNSTDFNPLSFTSPGAGPITDGEGLYQIDLSLHVTGLTASERGFGSLAFDAVLGANQTVGFDYGADSTQVDTNGAAPGGLASKYTTNQDAGTVGDYLGILLAGPGGNPAAVDPRATVGDPDPEFFGSMFVQVTGDGTLGFGNYQFSIRDLTTGDFLTPQVGTINSIVFDLPGGGGDLIDPIIAPLVRNVDLNLEPDTIDNLQLTATDDVTPVDSLVWSNLVYAGPGKSHPASLDALMNSDGVFNWNPAGWKAGVHTFNATVADAAGNDVAGLALTVNLTVPEPATFGLAGLAMVGLVGLIRRRS